MRNGKVVVVITVVAVVFSFLVAVHAQPVPPPGSIIARIDALEQSVLNAIAALQTSVDDLATQSDTLQTSVDDIETNLNAKLDIKHVTAGPVAIDFAFDIRVQCSENFQVKAVYSSVDDPDNDIDIRYIAPPPTSTGAMRAVGNFDGTIPKSWEILHAAFFDPAASRSESPYELLSQLDPERPIGIPGGGFLQIIGVAESTLDNTNDTLSVGAVVETSQTATCSVTIIG